MQNKKKHLTFFLTLIYFFTYISMPFPFLNEQILAQDKEEDEEASSAAEIAQDDQEKVDEILETLEKVAKDKEKNQKIKEDYKVEAKKKGFIAEVEEVNEYTIKVVSQKETQILTRADIDESASLIKNKKDIKTDDIEIGDWLIIMGFEDDDGFHPRRILVFKKDLNPPKKISKMGVIDEIRKTEVSFINKQNGEKEVYKFNRNTRWQNKDTFRSHSSKFEKSLEVLYILEEKNDELILSTIHSTVDLEELK
jgi:hypothetical protein